MGCCLALAYLFAQARRARFAVLPGTPTVALAFAPTARRPAPGRPAFDVVLPATLPATRTTRPTRSAGRALVGVGLSWFVIGLVGMHVFGWFGWAETSLLVDTAFHSSGLWAAAGGAALLAVKA